MLILNSKKDGEKIRSIFKRDQIDYRAIITDIEPLVTAVKKYGDKAIIKRQMAKNPKLSISIAGKLIYDRKDQKKAYLKMPKEFIEACENSINNLEKFHKTQIQKRTDVEISDGIICYREFKPIEKVGLYIPGGSAPLPSTLMMLAVPAKIAGCTTVVVCTPPNKSGEIEDSILATAYILGMDNLILCKVGGTQAISAMANGTESVPKVDKIFGPGNKYVTAAKLLVSTDVSIDMPAGPSEILVIADKTANPAFIAADLLSQAEHDPSSQAILIIDSEKIANLVNMEIEKQMQDLPRKTIITKALENSAIVITENLDKAIRLSNEYAPEHLIIQTDDAEKIAEMVTNAGSVFIGEYSTESAGDYCSGTNHSLPTSGFAKSVGPVSTEMYGKYVQFQSLTKKGLETILPTIETLAEFEGLEAHKRAASIRIFNQ